MSMERDESGDGIRRAEVRYWGPEDTRRQAAVEMFKRHVKDHIRGCDYDADIEYMEHAIIAFADEWAGVARDGE